MHDTLSRWNKAVICICDLKEQRDNFATCNHKTGVLIFDLFKKIDIFTFLIFCPLNIEQQQVVILALFFPSFSNQTHISRFICLFVETVRVETQARTRSSRWNFLLQKNTNTL